MKTVLSQTLAFFLYCIVATFFGATVFMFYFGCASYVAGSPHNLFSAKLFLDGVLIVFPCALLFAPMFLTLYLIRHSSMKKNWGAIATWLLTILVWVFAVPVTSRAAFEGNVFFSYESPPLSAGYFRKLENKVYYFSKVNGHYTCGIEFGNDLHSKEHEDSIEIFHNRYMLFNKDAYGFSDCLAGELLKPPKILASFFVAILSIEHSAFSAANSGILNWLSFSTMILALLAVCVFLSISTWRLSCALCVVLSTFAILLLNFFYLNFYFLPLTSRLENFGKFFISVKNNFQFVMNFSIFLLLCTAGAISFFAKRVASK